MIILKNIEDDLSAIESMHIGSVEADYVDEVANRSGAVCDSMDSHDGSQVCDPHQLCELVTQMGIESKLKVSIGTTTSSSHDLAYNDDSTDDDSEGSVNG